MGSRRASVVRVAATRPRPAPAGDTRERRGERAGSKNVAMPPGPAGQEALSFPRQAGPTRVRVGDTPEGRTDRADSNGAAMLLPRAAHGAARRTRCVPRGERTQKRRARARVGSSRRAAGSSLAASAATKRKCAAADPGGRRSLNAARLPLGHRPCHDHAVAIAADFSSLGAGAIPNLHGPSAAMGADEPRTPCARARRKGRSCALHAAAEGPREPPRARGRRGIAPARARLHPCKRLSARRQAAAHEQARGGHSIEQGRWAAVDSSIANERVHADSDSARRASLRPSTLHACRNLARTARDQPVRDARTQLAAAGPRSALKGRRERSRDIRRVRARHGACWMGAAPR